MRKLTKTLMASAAAIGMAMASPVLASSQPGIPGFSAAQNQALGQFIESYMLNHPDILMKMVAKMREKQAQSQQQAAEGAVKTILAQHNQFVSGENALVAGLAKAPITIVEFFDYQCSACVAAHSQLVKFLNSDFGKKNVRVVYRSFPFFGPASVYAAKAALAANLQGKGVAMHEAIFNTHKMEGQLTDAAVDAAAKKIGVDVAKMKKDMSSPAVTKEMAIDQNLVKAIKLAATPAFVFTPTSNAAANASNTTFVNSALLEAQFEKNAKAVLGSSQAEK